MPKKRKRRQFTPPEGRSTASRTSGPAEAVSARYTPPSAARYYFRPGWHKVVGAALVAIGAGVFFSCELSLFGIHNYGGHVWFLVGLLIAASSSWWFGLFDPPM